jgi:hypothetical protein
MNIAFCISIDTSKQLYQSQRAKMERCMRKLILIAIAGCALGAETGHAGPILINGNFESGNLSGWTATGAVSATLNTTYVSNSHATGNTGTGIVASFGGGEGSGGVLSQSIETVSGQVYMLSFQYGAIGPNPTIQEIRVKAGDLDQTVISAVSTNNLTSAFASHTFRFTASAPNTTISFADVSSVTSSIDGLLDNVTVGEPKSLLILGTGLIGISVIRRRRSVLMD